jgi:hypothetical protein
MGHCIADQPIRQMPLLRYHDSIPDEIEPVFAR